MKEGIDRVGEVVVERKVEVVVITGLILLGMSVIFLVRNESWTVEALLTLAEVRFFRSEKEVENQTSSSSDEAKEEDWGGKERRGCRGKVCRSAPVTEFTERDPR